MLRNHFFLNFFHFFKEVETGGERHTLTFGCDEKYDFAILL